MREGWGRPGGGGGPAGGVCESSVNIRELEGQKHKIMGNWLGWMQVCEIQGVLALPPSGYKQ